MKTPVSRKRILAVAGLAFGLSLTIIISGIVKWSRSARAAEPGATSSSAQNSSSGASQSGGISDSALRQIQALLNEKKARSSVQQKLDS